MKNCTKCKYAEWEKTKTGRLHPSGEGKCTYPYFFGKLPASMCWINCHVSGGNINRRIDLEEDCVYYEEG